MITISPPPVRGIGNAGGFKMMVEDRRGRGLTALNDAVQGMVAAGNQQPELAGVFSVFNTNTPNIYANIDRVRAEMLGVTPDQVFETLEVYLGSAYVNQFNYLGRTYQVLVQADGPFRKEIPEVADYKTRNAQGKMVPLGSVANFEDRLGPYRLPRYNLYTAGEVQGSPAPGHSTGEALAAMEKLAAENLPDGFSFEWTELAYQEKLAGNTGLFVFAASVVFVFLVLAAQYESWSLPLSVILIVPMCLLAAVSGLLFRGMDVNILAQVGFIVLVGLGGQERHPDRGVRPPGRGGGQAAGRGRHRGGPGAAPADPHDLLRLHLRRAAAGHRRGRRRRDAPIPRHRGLLRHAGRDRLRPALHPHLLRRHPRPLRPAKQSARAILIKRKERGGRAACPYRQEPGVMVMIGCGPASNGFVAGQKHSPAARGCTTGRQSRISWQETSFDSQLSAWEGDGLGVPGTARVRFGSASGEVERRRSRSR